MNFSKETQISLFTYHVVQAFLMQFGGKSVNSEGKCLHLNIAVYSTVLQCSIACNRNVRHLWWKYCLINVTEGGLEENRNMCKRLNRIYILSHSVSCNCMKLACPQCQTVPNAATCDLQAVVTQTAVCKSQEMSYESHYSLSILPSTLEVEYCADLSSSFVSFWSSFCHCPLSSSSPLFNPPLSFF